MNNILTANDGVDIWLHNNLPGLPGPKRRAIWTEDRTCPGSRVIIEHDDTGVKIDMERTLISGVTGAPQRNIAEPPHRRECRPIVSLGFKVPDGEASHRTSAVYQICIFRVIENIFGLIADGKQVKEHILP